MNIMPFIGRQRELKELQLFLKKKVASFLVMRGRRRIGKSRLIEEFAKPYTLYKITGLAPREGITAQHQRDHFARTLSMMSDLPEVHTDDWFKLFVLLAQAVKTGRAIVLLDEISWMAMGDPDFLGKLKTAWDDYFKQNPKLIFIICGSVSSWIDDNILSSSGFVGRISLPMTLKELPLHDSNSLLTTLGIQASVYERFKILSITGGVPRYIEEFNPSQSAEENIKRLCFTENGVLFNEFDSIFADLFGSHSVIYEEIVLLLVNQTLTFNDICEKLQKQKSGHVSKMLNDLTSAGFIARDYTWHVKTSKESNLSVYRLSDNYLRFYLKYIKKYKTRIERGHFEDVALSSLPGWSSIVGLQFENLVLSNRHLIIDALGINRNDILIDNPYFQTKTTRTQGCQIDYLIQTRFNTLYACEIKFSRHPIKSSVVEEMRSKLAKLVLPRGYSCIPVLIHVNGVDETVEDADYFAKIIDFTEFLA